MATHNLFELSAGYLHPSFFRIPIDPLLARDNPGISPSIHSYSPRPAREFLPQQRVLVQFVNIVSRAFLIVSEDEHGTIPADRNGSRLAVDPRPFSFLAPPDLL